MVQPFHADLLAGARAHRFFDIVAGAVAEQAVDPADQLAFGLFAELRLTVEGPAEQPVGILDGDNPSGHHLAAEGVSAADFLHIRRNASVQRRDGCAHPVGLLRVIAEFVRVAKALVLLGNPPPEVPAASLSKRRVVSRRRVLGAKSRVLHTTAVGDKEQIVFAQVDPLRRLLRTHQQFDMLGQLSLRLDVKSDVADLGVVVELHAVPLQIADHRQDHRLVLIIAGEAQRRKIRQSADVVDVPLDIPLHLQRAVPVFKGKHGAPVHPEVGLKDLVVKKLVDSFVIQRLVRSKKQPHDLLCRLVGEAELVVCVGAFAAVLGRAHQRVVGVFLVEPVILIQHADPFRLDGGDGAVQIPHHLKVVVHLATAAHDITKPREFVSVAGAARNRILLKDVDMAARHLPVAHQIAGGGQGRQAGADDVCRLVLNILWLLRAGKGFIVSAGIIHKRYLRFFIFCLYHKQSSRRKP